MNKYDNIPFEATIREASPDLCQELEVPIGTRLYQCAPRPFKLHITEEDGIGAKRNAPKDCVMANTWKRTQGTPCAIYSQKVFTVQKLNNKVVIVQYDHRAASRRVFEALDHDGNAITGLDVVWAPMSKSRSTVARAMSKGTGQKLASRKVASAPRSVTRPIFLNTRSCEVV